MGKDGRLLTTEDFNSLAMAIYNHLIFYVTEFISFSLYRIISDRSSIPSIHALCVCVKGCRGVEVHGYGVGCVQWR